MSQMRLLFFATLLCVAPAAHGQPLPQARLTLEDAIARGLANSRRLAELDARAQAAEFAISGRQSAERPLVALLGGYTRTNHVDEFAISAPGRAPQIVYPDIPDNYRARIDLQWPIYTGGRGGALERAARAERSAIARDVDAARADLRLEITRAFWAIVTAGDTESVLRRAFDVTNAHVADVKAKLASGLIPPNDVSSAEAQASHQRLLALEAANQRAIAEADLRRLIGNETGPLALAPPTSEGTGATEPGERSGASEGRSASVRSERLALEQRAQAAVERANAIAASARPQVSIGGGYDYARPNPRIFPRSGDWKTSWDTSINVSWTLWDGGRRGAEQGETRALASALQARIEDFDRQAAFEIRARTLELASNREAVTAAADGIRAAAEAERVVGERYKAGVATSTDVLDAQVARLRAELDRARAVAGVRLAEARLERALGR
jgi:outer membrane protein